MKPGYGAFLRNHHHHRHLHHHIITIIMIIMITIIIITIIIVTTFRNQDDPGITDSTRCSKFPRQLGKRHHANQHQPWLPSRQPSSPWLLSGLSTMGDDDRGPMGSSMTGLAVRIPPGPSAPSRSSMR